MAKKQSGINIQVNDAELQKIYDGLKEHKKVAAKAVVAALNRTIQSANTELQKHITSIYNIKRKDLSGGSKYKGERSNNIVKLKKASLDNFSASINVRGSNLTLYRFVQGNKQPSNKKGARVKVKVKKSNAAKMSNVNFINYPRGNKNNLQIFQRHRSSRDISRLLRTTSVAHMAANKDVIEPTQEKANETLQKRVEHELQYRLSKIKG